MYINFCQNRVSIDQSKPCTQSYLQKNRKLHKYATYNLNFKTKLLSDMHHRITYLYINFQQNRVSRSVKTVHTSLFANYINLQLAIRISKNHAFLTCTTPSRTFRPILSSISLLDNELPRKEIISTDGRQTDRRTDGQTSRTTTIGSFFEKKKKILKIAPFRPALPNLRYLG